MAEIEAEISTARLAGMAPDGGSGKEAPSGDDAAAESAAGADARPDTTPEQEGEAADAGTAGAASGADGPETPDEPDGPEAVGEHVDLEGLTIGPSPAPAPAAVRLYDVEAEAAAGFDAEFDAGTGPQQGQAPEAPDDAAAASDETEPMSEAPSADAGAIFARLRSITSQPVGEPEPWSAEPGAAGHIAAAGAPRYAPGFADEPDEFADEVDEEFDGAGAATVPADPDDLVGAARAVAVGGIARRLKRLVVDEQGDLLDAVRRNGVRAVRSAITGDTGAYTRAVRVPMQDFASDIDVSIDDVDLQAAGRAILSVLVEPVRERLGQLIEGTDDPDELTTAVRSIYRESRSRRADTAAEAAFSAGWPEPIT